MRKSVKIVLIILFFLFICALTLYYFLVVKVSFTQAQLSTAESVLGNGVTINDDQNDFVPMGGKEESGDENNSKPYALDYADLKSLSIASDDTYLYIREQFWGNFPKNQEKIDGDPIKTVGIKVNIVDKSGKDEAILCSSVGYMFLPFQIIGHYSFTEPTGIEWPEGDRFKTKTTSGMVYGKAGIDYILLAIPLKDLKISSDQEIYVTCSVEVESKKFGHASVDVLMGSGKQGAIIKVNLGTREFSIE